MTTGIWVIGPVPRSAYDPAKAVTQSPRRVPVAKAFVEASARMTCWRQWLQEIPRNQAALQKCRGVTALDQGVQPTGTHGAERSAHLSLHVPLTLPAYRVPAWPHCVLTHSRDEDGKGLHS